MLKPTSRRHFLPLLALAAIAGAAPAQAQSFPVKPVRLVVPYPAGGAADVVARAVAVKAAEKLGQPVVVENRPGAGGVIGAQAVLNAPADGYTLVVANLPALSSVFVRNPPFDTDRDFAPVAPLFRSQYLLAINSAVPAKNLKEFVAYARTRPGKLNYAAGYVTATLPMVMLTKATGTDMVAVPYKGSTPAMLALRTNEVQVAFDNLGVLGPMQQQGVARILAVAGETRLSQIPEVPTTAELGYPKLRAGGTVGIWAPAGTPKAVVDKLNEAFAIGLTETYVKARVAAEGGVIATGKAEELARRNREERAGWAEMAQMANFRPE